MRLHIDHLSQTYGTQRALDNLSLSIAENTRCLALIGPSGGGKSTLLRHLGALEIPATGTITVNGTPLPRDEPALRVTLPLVQVHGHTPDAARALAEEQLVRFGLHTDAAKRPVQLSGGQQQRVALIRAIVAKPELLFLDEPTAALDPEMTVEVLELIRELIRAGQEVILCTHEMGFARAVADSVAFIAEGKVLECAPPSTLFASPQHETVRRFLSRVLEFR